MNQPTRSNKKQEDKPDTPFSFYVFAVLLVACMGYFLLMMLFS